MSELERMETMFQQIGDKLTLSQIDGEMDGLSTEIKAKRIHGEPGRRIPSLV